MSQVLSNSYIDYEHVLAKSLLKVIKNKIGRNASIPIPRRKIFLKMEKK